MNDQENKLETEEINTVNQDNVSNDFKPQNEHNDKLYDRKVLMIWVFILLLVSGGWFGVNYLNNQSDSPTKKANNEVIDNENTNDETENAENTGTENTDAQIDDTETPSKYEGIIYTKESKEVLEGGYSTDPKTTTNLPYINIDTEEVRLLNEKITKMYETDQIQFPDYMKYEYYIVKDSFAILKITDRSLCGCGHYGTENAFVIDLEEGEVLDSSEIIALAGITYEEAFINYQNVVVNENGDYDEYEPGEKPNLTFEEFKKLDLSFSRDGELEVIVLITSVVSAAYEYVTVQN